MTGGGDRDTQVPGPLSQKLSDRNAFGPMEWLGHHALAVVQRESAASPRRSYSLSARALFTMMDLVYGTPRTLAKFRVLELVARVPYQAWESVAYVAVTHTARSPGFAGRVFRTVRLARWEQDNEQWHLMVNEEITGGARRGFVRHTVVPQALALVYYRLSWLMFVVRPRWSYRLNADFEDHAEHEYALFVAEHPEWETTPYNPMPGMGTGLGGFDSLADVFRQISYDERLHKLESESRLNTPRFG